MTHICCPACRLRLSPVDAAAMAVCPECGDRLQTVSRLEDALGFRLFEFEEDLPLLPRALAAALLIPEPPGTR
jgi:hypothetical protein